jgi:hypothetical protein
VRTKWCGSTAHTATTRFPKLSISHVGLDRPALAAFSSPSRCPCQLFVNCDDDRGRRPALARIVRCYLLATPYAIGSAAQVTWAPQDDKAHRPQVYQAHTESSGGFPRPGESVGSDHTPPAHTRPEPDAGIRWTHVNSGPRTYHQRRVLL